MSESSSGVFRLKRQARDLKSAREEEMAMKKEAIERVRVSGAQDRQTRAEGGRAWRIVTS